MSAAENQASHGPAPAPPVRERSAHSVTLGVVYCTGNAGKFREASHVFDEWNAYGHPLRVQFHQRDADPVEIQGTAREVCHAKVKAAMEILVGTAALDNLEDLKPYDRLDVVSADVGLELGCLNGFPGVYCKPMLETIGDGGLWDLVRRYDDKSARVTCNLGYCTARFNVPGDVDFVQRRGYPGMFVGALEGSIGPPRGDVKHGATSWNSVFTPAGRAQTFGETPFEEQAKFSHRRQAILQYLKQVQEELLADPYE